MSKFTFHQSLDHVYLMDFIIIFNERLLTNDDDVQLNGHMSKCKLQNSIHTINQSTTGYVSKTMKSTGKQNLLTCTNTSSTIPFVITTNRSAS